MNSIELNVGKHNDNCKVFLKLSVGVAIFDMIVIRHNFTGTDGFFPEPRTIASGSSPSIDFQSL